METKIIGFIFLYDGKEGIQHTSLFPSESCSVWLDKLWRACDEFVTSIVSKNLNSDFAFKICFGHLECVWFPVTSSQAAFDKSKSPKR